MHSELLLSLVPVGAVGVLPGLDGHERDQHGTGLHWTGSHVSESKLVKDWGGGDFTDQRDSYLLV